MQPFDGLTGPITFDSRGRRANFSIDIYRVEFSMPLTKIGVYSSNQGLKIIDQKIFRNNHFMEMVNRDRIRKVSVILVIISFFSDSFISNLKYLFALKCKTETKGCAFSYVKKTHA